jgi:hypothetical protein
LQDATSDVADDLGFDRVLDQVLGGGEGGEDLM